MHGIFLRKRLGLLMGDSKTQLLFLQNTVPFVIRVFSSSNQPSFTVSYLVNSCGLSPENAISASRKIRLQGPENPDSVLALLGKFGCSSTHILKIVTKFPFLLLAREKILLPKLEFFHSIGLSGVTLGKVLSSNPLILRRSLHNHLIPNYNFLKSVVMGEGNLLKCITNLHWDYSTDLQKIMTPNIAVLKEIGVPTKNISNLIARSPNTVTSKKFSRSLAKVSEMGFDPLKFVFVLAIEVICLTSESAWEHKMDVYGRWGWDDDEILRLFKCHPFSMNLSEEKIMSVMDFLVNKMGWQPAGIAKVPIILFYNFEKRIIPRCSVVKVLLSNGLVKSDLSLSTFLLLTERKFLDRYVIKYQKSIPQLSNLYHGKVSLQQLGF